MNPRLKALLEQKQALVTEAQALDAKADWNENETARSKELPSLIAAADQAIDETKDFSSIVKGANETLNGFGKIMSQAAAGQIVKDIAAENAAVRYRGRVNNFTGANEREKAIKAYRFGMWLMATGGNRSAIAYCQGNGLPVVQDLTGGASFGRDVSGFQSSLGQNELVNEDGGYLVPPEFEADLIILREMYGVFRQFARVTPMKGDTKSRPRRKSGLTAYFTGDGEAATASKMGWDRVSLTAKKVMVLDYTTTELDEDSMINLGDTLAGEIAYAFAKLEDDCGFNGDGTSTYGGIVGARAKLKNISGTIASIKGLFVGAGNNYSELTLSDFTGVLGLLPQYADTPNTGWFVHKTFYHQVMEKLMLAAGGVTAAEVAAGRRTLVFMGYPVHISQQMPRVEANSQVCCLFGDMRLAADFGDRRATTIMFSEHAAFTTDEIAIRGTERFDINVHDVGDTTDPGPLVGLITAAS
jgi:HK97 family phage major capsid protein